MSVRPVVDELPDNVDRSAELHQTVTPAIGTCNDLDGNRSSGRPGPSPLQEQIHSLVKSLRERSQRNVWGNRFFSPQDIQNTLDHSRLHSLAEAFYNEAEKRRDILPKQKAARILELVSFIKNGNRKALAIILFCNGGYDALQHLDRNAHKLRDHAAQSYGRLEVEGRLCIDSGLPLSEAETDALGPQMGPNFFDMQWAFIPVILQENERWVQDDPRLRLPIIERWHIGSGSSSDVYEIKIAPFCWEVEKGGRHYPIAKPQVLAQKVYRGETRKEREDQRNRENDILRIHREASTHHNNIMALRGVLDHGEELSLLFDLMDGSLQDRLNSDEGMTMSFHTLMTALARLGEALGFCHKGVPINGRSNSVYHRDFRPDNIFIQGEQFMVGDFGMSKVITLDERGLTEYSKENGSTYSAPKEVKGSSRDIWGFITTIIVALVHKVGGRDLVREFSNARTQDGKSDKFWTRQEEIVSINNGMTNWIIGHRFNESLKQKYPKLANGITVLLDYLIFTYLERLLHNGSSDDVRNSNRAPTAENVMGVLDEMAQWLPTNDTDELPYPGSRTSFMTENTMVGATNDGFEFASPRPHTRPLQDTQDVLDTTPPHVASAINARGNDIRPRGRSSDVSVSENTQAGISEVFSQPSSDAAAISQPTLPTTWPQTVTESSNHGLPTSRDSSAVRHILDNSTSAEPSMVWGRPRTSSNLSNLGNPILPQSSQTAAKRPSRIRSGLDKLLQGLQEVVNSPIRRTYPRRATAFGLSTNGSSFSLSSN